MEQTSLYLLILAISMVSVSAEVPRRGDVMRVSLRLSPDRAQFFKSEHVLLSCEDRQSNSTVWRVINIKNIKNITSECDDWGEKNNTGCLLGPMQPLVDSGLYWCESSKGKSNTVNITVTGGDVILGSPVLPVMEGSDVTIDVTDSPTSTNNPRSPSLPTYFYPLMFAGVSIFLLIMGLCLWKKYNGCSRTDRRDLDVTYADVRVTTGAQHRERRDQTPEEQDIYSTVKTNTDQTSEEQVMYSTVKTNTDQTYEGQGMYSTVKINTGGDV